MALLDGEFRGELWLFGPHLKIENTWCHALTAKSDFNGNHRTLIALARCLLSYQLNHVNNHTPLNVSNDHGVKPDAQSKLSHENIFHST